MSIRLITINTAKGDGPYTARLATMAEQLAAAAPDIVACQEVLVADGFDTAATLARALRMSVAYYPARDKPRQIEGVWRPSWSGMAVLSRWTARDLDAIVLPSDPADGERIALRCAFSTPLGVVRLVNLHLTHLRHRADLRRAQLETILADPWLREPATARILIGDFNATRASAEMQWLFSGVHGWSARDTAPPDALWGTVRQNGGFVSPPMPGVAIDFIVSLAPTPDDHPRFGDARVLLDRAGANGVCASDHLAVGATLIDAPSGPRIDSRILGVATVTGEA